MASAPLVLMFESRKRHVKKAFDTGLTSFTVLMAVFGLVASVIPESKISKLSNYESEGDSSITNPTC